MRSLFLLIFFFLVEGTLAQEPIEYEVSFENANHHEAVVKVHFKKVTGTPLQIRMSRTSPGRYALHEFAKNVYNFNATDSKGKRLDVSRPNPHQWNVSGHDGEVIVTYTIFGARTDGTYLGIDNTHAHMNIPATFIWARGYEDRPIEITFKKPDDWSVATQLVPTNKPNTFTAPNLAYFMDSPTEISRFELYEWNLANSPHKIRLAIHHDGTPEEAVAYTELIKAVAEEEVAIFGEVPNFDYAVYTFIADYLAHVNGDGMEHRNSTILTTTRDLKEHAVDNLYTVSHEFFHAWNVERIRPRSLEPFDFENANMSGELWFAEGFTSYYDDLVLKRAEIISIDRYAEGLSKLLTFVLNAPGSRYFNAVEMSEKAPFVDAARSVDPRNLANTFISYYSYGATIGLGLDLTLRHRFPAVTLNDFIRAVWEKHGKTEIPYTNEDLRQILAEVTGDASFANSFFEKYIYGNEFVNYEMLLAQGGFLLRKAKKDEAWLGRMNFDYEDDKIKIRSSTLIDSPLYLAGLDLSDTILKIDARAIPDEDSLKNFLKEFKPEDKVEIEFENNGVEKTAELTFQENPEFEVVPFEHVGSEITPEIESFRTAWLGQKSTFDVASLQRFCPKCSRAFPFQNEYCFYDGEKLELTPTSEKE